MGKNSRRTAVFAGFLAAIGGAGLWFTAAKPIHPLPDVHQIGEMYFRRVGENYAKIPPDLWKDVLAALSPTYDRSDHSTWEIRGFLKIVSRETGTYEIILFGNARQARFDMTHDGVLTPCIGGNLEQLMRVLNEVEPTQRDNSQVNP